MHHRCFAATDRKAYFRPDAAALHGEDGGLSCGQPTALPLGALPSQIRIVRYPDTTMITVLSAFPLSSVASPAENFTD